MRTGDGGGDLGLKMLCDALRAWTGREGGALVDVIANEALSFLEAAAADDGIDDAASPFCSRADLVHLVCVCLDIRPQVVLNNVC